MPGNLFSEDETTQIVKRAAQLQEETQSGTYSPGVTEDELARIAQEMGISPEFLQRAIQEQQNKAVQPERAGPFKKLVFERVVDGEVSPDDFDLFQDIPNSAQNGHNWSTQVGRTLQSTGMVGMSQVKTTVTSREGRTRVRIESTPILSIVFGLELVLFGLIFGGIATAASPLAGAATLLGLGGAGLALLLKWPKAGAKRSAELLEKICGTVTEIARTVER